MSRWPAHQWWRLTSTGLCAVVLAVGFMAPTFAKDPGDVAGLRAANRAWHRCLVNQRPLVAAVKSTSAMARRAKSAVEAAADRVKAQQTTLVKLTTEARKAKAAMLREHRPKVRQRLRKIALNKAIVANKAADTLKRLQTNAGHAKERLAQANKAAVVARRKLAGMPCPKPVWSPNPFSEFSYPKADTAQARTAIRYAVLSAIEHSPRGSSIRIATYAFADAAIENALIAAAKRGVSVRVLVATTPKNDESRSWARLKHALGSPGRGAHKSTWARACVRSCRGASGTMHTKMYLFSHVGHQRWVTMFGSANLTRFAFQGQWNHIDSVIGKSTYDRFSRIFSSMAPDHPVKQEFQRFHTSQLSGMLFPNPRGSVKNDPMTPVLNQIRCEGVNKTVVRISMYSWFDDRGIALARLVRKKWDQGCDVKIVVGLTNNLVRQALRHKGKRGPVPMRVVYKSNQHGDQLYYDHSKYVAISGNYADTQTKLVWTGSMNFTAFGFSNDEIVIRLNGSRVYSDYAQNFQRVWNAPQAQLPKPFS